MASTLELLLLAQSGYLSANTPVLLYQAQPTSGGTVTYTVNNPYNRIMCVWYARSSTAAVAEQMYLQFNGITTSTYLWQYVQGNNTTVAGGDSGGAVTQIQLATIPGSTATANYWGSGQFIVDGASQSTNFSTVQGTGCGFSSSTNSWNGTYCGQFLSGAAITSILLYTNGGGFALDSQFSFYGLN